MSSAGRELKIGGHQLFILYKEAVQWLQLVAKESQKSENVDLKRLLSAEEKCVEIIRTLLNEEINPIRIAALEQLSITLEHHKHVFKATQDHIASGPSLTEQTVRVSHAGVGAVSVFASDKGGECDEQFTRRKHAIEETILTCEREYSFANVAGLNQAKQALREAIVLPIKYPHLFTGSCCPWRRVLLYGPPGTGKTHLAQAVSGEIESTFYCVSSSDLISSWVGESEKIIKDLFSHAKKRSKAVIFIDEIDSICRQRQLQEEEHTRRVKTELLRQMEGANFELHSRKNCNEVFLLCATNCPWELDPAFLRRFQRRIYIPLPDREACREIINQRLTPDVIFTDTDWDSILFKAGGCSGSDLAVCVTDALLQPVREMEQATHWRTVKVETIGREDSVMYIPCGAEEGVNVPCEGDEQGVKECSLHELPPHQVYPRKVCATDLIDAINRCGQTVRKSDLDKYVEFTDIFGQVG